MIAIAYRDRIRIRSWRSQRNRILDAQIGGLKNPFATRFSVFRKNTDLTISCRVAK